jgi:type IV pilus assembly protein PilP
MHPALPDTHRKYEAQEYINSVKPLYESKPDASKVVKTKKSRIPRTPLERIHISQLKLVGIVVSADGNKALLESASGKGYVVQEGAFIGTNSGKIVEIQKDRIVIEEEIEDVIGNVKIFRTELRPNSIN